jgi:hypothetical protein
MRDYMRRSVIPICVLLVLVTAGTVFGSEETFSEAQLPPGVTMAAGFEPGLGSSIGRVLLVDGPAAIIHAEDSKGYGARQQLPLYKRDNLITDSQGHLQFQLNDESVISLATDARLELTESVYDTKERNRFSFLNMLRGKSHFLVKKLADFRRSEFKVKTKTAVAGVRGSEFIIVVTFDRTEIIALADTILEVISLAHPGAAPTILRAYQKTLIEEGKLPTIPEEISLEQAQELMRGFIFSTEARVSIVRAPAGTGSGSTKGADAPKGASSESAEQLESKVMLEFPLRVPEHELIDPDVIMGAEEMEKLLAAISKDLELSRGLSPIQQEIEEIVETEKLERIEDRIDTDVIEILSEDTIQDLPGLPGTP